MILRPFPDYCGEEVSQFYSVGFNGGERSKLRSGATQWDPAKDYTGAQILNIDENQNQPFTSPGRWRVEKGAIFGDGQAFCESRVIVISSSLNKNNYPDVFAHELGHALGFWHTGSSDALDGTVPLMVTCLGASTAETFSKDDAAAVQNLHGSITNPGAGSIMGNWGFERWSGSTPVYWNFVGSHSKVVQSPQFGSSSLGWKPLSNGAYFYQEVVVNRTANFGLTPRSSIKRPTAGTVTGSITLDLYLGERFYGSNVTGCAYPVNRNMNQVTFDAPLGFARGGSEEPTTSWASYDFYAPSYPIAFTGSTSYIARLRVDSTVQQSGDWRQVDFDNTRIWDD